MDLIERQAAIDALLEKGQASRRYKLGQIWELNFDEIREAIACVPSVKLKSYDAMKKQIPKKPIKADSPYFKYACPACGNYPLSGHYCNECGQAIDWTEGE